MAPKERRQRCPCRADWRQVRTRRSSPHRGTTPTRTTANVHLAPARSSPWVQDGSGVEVGGDNDDDDVLRAKSAVRKERGASGSVAMIGTVNFVPTLGPSCSRWTLCGSC